MEAEHSDAVVDAEMPEAGRAEVDDVIDDKADYVSLGGSDHASAKSMDGERNILVRLATDMNYVVLLVMTTAHD